MIIYCQDTYQLIHRRKNIYTPPQFLTWFTVPYTDQRHFFTWVIVISTDQRLISNMYNDHKYSGHLSTNLQAKKYIYPVFWLESQYYLQINTWFQICTMIINIQDTYQQIYKRKNIYIPFFDLSHSTIYKSTPDFKYVQWS